MFWVGLDQVLLIDTSTPEMSLRIMGLGKEVKLQSVYLSRYFSDQSPF